MKGGNKVLFTDPKIIAVGETTSFSFSGAGFLSLFHVGAGTKYLYIVLKMCLCIYLCYMFIFHAMIATRLKELNVISTKTQLYGCSGGALAAASVPASHIVVSYVI